VLTLVGAISIDHQILGRLVEHAASADSVMDGRPLIDKAF
jgi:hypothetical protein